MRKDILDRIATDLLSVPPLIYRGIGRKLLKTALGSVDMDISPLQFGVMKLLKETGTLHIAEIGERLQVSRAQMTHVVDKLVDFGIVERQMDATDRRMTNIVLTAKGEATLEEHSILIRQATKETLSGLTDKELTDLSESLEKLQVILSKLQ
jgi:DNA-binding MarR family transcriptional regulator